MKNIFLFALLFCLAHQVTFANSYYSSYTSILIESSADDIILVSDVEKIAMYAKTKKLSTRASDQFKLANESYSEGFSLLQQDKFKKSITSLKTAYKNYNRAKINDDALNFINVQLAIAYVRSEEVRDQKKAIKLLESVTKSIYKEKVWAYNISVMQNILGKEKESAEILESVIKMDKFFFKAYEDLVHLYTDKLNEPKKAEKIRLKLTDAQELLAEKERKSELAALKEKEKTGIPQKPNKKNEHPKGVVPHVDQLVVIGDAKTLMKNESISSFNAKTRKNLTKGEVEYDKGIAMFNSGEYDLAAKAFKSAMKKYARAKVKQSTLDYITVHLAMSYSRSPNKRSKKKVGPLLEDLSKGIYKEREWAYSVAVMCYNIEQKDKALDLLRKCTDLDKYFLTGYQNQIALYNEQGELKKALKAYKNHQKHQDELTRIYREYVRTGNMPEGIDLSFLDGSIFRIALGDFNEYYLPVDIYLHDDLLIVPLGDDYYSYLCGMYSNFLHAENYLSKLFNRYPTAHVVAFKDGRRTDFTIKE